MRFRNFVEFFKRNDFYRVFFPGSAVPQQREGKEHGRRADAVASHGEEARHLAVQRRPVSFAAAPGHVEENQFGFGPPSERQRSLPIDHHHPPSARYAIIPIFSSSQPFPTSFFLFPYHFKFESSKCFLLFTDYDCDVSKSFEDSSSLIKSLNGSPLVPRFLPLPFSVEIRFLLLGRDEYFSMEKERKRGEKGNARPLVKTGRN